MINPIYAAIAGFAFVALGRSLTTLAQPAPADASPAAAQRPHIVLFIADDHTWHDAGAYGASDVRTPNIDRLAQQGMRFDRAIAPSPTCTPSRSAIYTGLYPFRNGAHPNHSWIKPGVRTLPEYFRELGYRVVIAGKTHIGPREQFPFEYLKGSNVMPEGKNHVLWTDLNTRAVDELLEAHDKAKPLCLLVCAHSPHVYWPENQGYDPDTIDLPPYLLDTPQTRAMRTRYYTDVTHMDNQLGDVMQSLQQHGYEQNTMLIFTADQGAQWPMSKWTLYDAGIRSPLVVRWPDKVKPASSSDAIVSLIDLLPTMLEAAGGKPPEDLDAQSLLPVLSGQQTEHRDAVFATTTGDKNMNRSPARAIRTDKYKYILNLKPEDEFRTHISHAGGEDGMHYWKSWLKLAKTDPHAKQVIERYSHRPAEELYDVQADPYELKNVAEDPAHTEALAGLRERLKQWRLQQGEDLSKVPMPEDALSGPLPYAD
jgi:arylsulfatase A-like enzyme